MPKIKIQGHKVLGRKMEDVAGVLVKDVAGHRQRCRFSDGPTHMSVFYY